MAGSAISHSVPPGPGTRRRLPSPVRRRRARIEIVPLIDVMFFLLAAFMMVSLSMERSRAVRVELPVALSARDDFAPEALNIAVERDGTLSVDGARISWERLEEVLAGRRRDGEQRPVLVTADRLATHGSIAGVLDRIRRSGHQKVAFVTAAPARPAPEATSPGPKP